MQTVRFQGQPGSLYHNYATSLGGNPYKERYGEEALGKNPYADKAPQKSRKLLSSQEKAAQLMEQIDRDYYAAYEGKYPVDLRADLRNSLLRLSRAILIPSAEGTRFFRGHPFKEKLKREFGSIHKGEVKKALADLRPQSKRAHLFSRYKKIHEDDLYRTVSPAHWKEPIIQEQVLECLRDMIWRGECGFVGAQKAKGNKLWLYIRK